MDTYKRYSDAEIQTFEGAKPQLKAMLSISFAQIETWRTRKLRHGKQITCRQQNEFELIASDSVLPPVRGRMDSPNLPCQGTVKFIKNLPTEWANANILPPTHPPFPPGTALQTQW